MSIKAGQTILASEFTVSLVAGENLTANDAVYIKTSDGKVYKCDADDATTMDFFGFSMETVSTGAAVIVQHSGQMTGFSGLTINSNYYISGTAGAITLTAPAIIKLVGRALSATVIKITPFPSVRINKFIASGTWTKLPGLKYIEVTVVGGGGNGGSATAASVNTVSAGGGGGGGGYSFKTILASVLGTTETVTVGAATATSSFGAHASATGGTSGTAEGNGGLGGIGSSGDLNGQGSGGGAGEQDSSNANVAQGGVGGGSLLGGGGNAVAGLGGSNGPGVDGGLYGGGASGGVSVYPNGIAAGGTGAQGVVFVREFY